MGSRIARRLLAAGHEVVVWNRSHEKVVGLVRLGAIRAATPAEAARLAEVVITMVADARALQDVTEGSEGIAAGARNNTTVIQMSTVDRTAVSRLASALRSDTALLDAPVLGSVTEAETGALRIFVGGDPSPFQECMPLLSALGSPLHVGALGAGTAAKLVANGILLGVLGLLGEGLALAEGLGLPQETAFDILAATPLAEQAKRRSSALRTGEFPSRFTLRLARKDADLIVNAARDSGTDFRLGIAACSWIADADKAGWGNRDYSSVLAFILRSG